MNKIKGNLMFDKFIIKLIFNSTVWNETHILYWLCVRKIKYINIKLDKGFYNVIINKITKDTQLKMEELKGENEIYFYYL